MSSSVREAIWEAVEQLNPIIFQTGPYSKSRRRSPPSLREAVRRVSMMIGPLARVLFDLSSSRFSGPRRGIHASFIHG
jgi:hypothetical protein